LKKTIISTLVIVLILTIAAVTMSNFVGYEYDEYADATYRGIFADRDSIQVNVQFTLEDNTFTDLSFRHLYHGRVNYLEEEEGVFAKIAKQHKEALSYLEGKDVSAVDDLFEPENVVEEYKEVDGFSAATIRANKIISAVRDALNRGPYRY